MYYNLVYGFAYSWSLAVCIRNQYSRKIYWEESFQQLCRRETSSAECLPLEWVMWTWVWTHAQKAALTKQETECSGKETPILYLLKDDRWGSYRGCSATASGYCWKKYPIIVGRSSKEEIDMQSIGLWAIKCSLFYNWSGSASKVTLEIVQLLTLEHLRFLRNLRSGKVKHTCVQDVEDAYFTDIMLAIFRAENKLVHSSSYMDESFFDEKNRSER